MEQIKSEYGIFERDPMKLPNPADLSNGRRGGSLAHGVLNLTDPVVVKQWVQVLAWLASKGVPTSDITYFVSQQAGTSGADGYGSTQVIFADPAKGRFVAIDATNLYNDPSTQSESLQISFGLPGVGVYDSFPGFDKIDAQSSDPVGDPDPTQNTHRWTMPHARYYKVGPNFNAEKWQIGKRFERLSNAGDIEAIFQRTMRLVSQTGGTGIVAGGRKFDLQPYWERLR